MADNRRVLRPVISILLITATALGLMNVFADNAEVVAQAKDLACGGTTCKAQMTQMSRNPISQDFTFQTNAKESDAVRISCHREYYLVGPYKCSRAAQ
jgi:hypothetical protein